MKRIILIALCAFPVLSIGAEFHFTKGDVFVGDEVINERMTGEKCQISIADLEKLGEGFYQSGMSFEHSKKSLSNVNLWAHEKNAGKLNIFSGEHKVKTKTYSYFLILDRKTGQPKESKIHILGILSEQDYDCLNLQRLN